MEKLALSIIVPVHNEADNLTNLHAEIQSVVSGITPSYEILYINDGSTDSSLNELHSLAGATIVDLRRRYGQATALDAGFKLAEAPIVITMDGDGQNDPADIPRLIEALLRDDVDVVAGWRTKRKDRSSIRILTRIGRFLRQLLIQDGIHDSGCTLRAYRKEAVESLDLQGEMHRYIIALLRWKGFRVAEIPVTDRPRQNGISKYSSSKAIRGFIDLIYVWFIYKYSQRPLHFFGYMSIASFALGFVSMAWTLYGKLALGLSLNRNGWFFLSGFFLLAGILLFSFGIVIDLLIRIYLNTSQHEYRYGIRSIERV